MPRKTLGDTTMHMILVELKGDDETGTTR